MKFATASSFSRAWALLSLTMARATTTLRPSSTAGAVYFGANLDNNFIITNSIASDGTVKFARAICTHGQGATGAKSAPGPDPLFSQDSLKVSGSYLYAVNAGSNSVSMFKINQDDPTDLQIIGDAVDSGGDFPVSIAVSSSGNMVCVLNGGANNGVNCYAPNPWAGLIPISGTRRSLNLTQTTPPSGPPNTVSDIIFSPDGTKLLAAVKGTPPSPGFLAAWDIRADRSLSSTFEASTPAMGGALPFSITAVKGANAVLVTDPAIGFSIYDLTRLNVDNRVPATSTIVNVTGQKAICWSEYSPRTNRYYLSDAGASQIIEAEVNGHLQGSVVQRYSLTVNSTSLDTAIASLSHTDYLYVLSANSKAIDVFSLNQPGNAMHVQTYSFDTTLQNAGVTVDSSRLQGMAVYVKN